MTRFESDAGNYLTQPVVQELFKLTPGKTRAVRTAEGNVIVYLKQIELPDLAKDKEALDRFGKQLDTMMANDLILELIAALRIKYGVTVDEAVRVVQGMVVTFAVRRTVAGDAPGAPPDGQGTDEADPLSSQITRAWATLRTLLFR